MDFLARVIGDVNNILWSYVIIAMLIGLGLYFSFRVKFVQVRYFGEMIRLLGDGVSSKTRKAQKEKSGVSSFQAFCMSTASRVGTGNLAGVAIAISAGGPGAVFWMWLIAVIGGASAFVESTLAQIYKVKDGNAFRGGPAYYMEKGLNKRWLGVVFSVLITVSFGLIFNAVQSNTVAAAFDGAFKTDSRLVGLVMAGLLAVIIFGGVKRIARAVEMIVPVMAIIYVAVALFVVVTNITSIPYVFKEIFLHAFGIKEVVGGGLGAAILLGVKRGLFSNEAGMGSAPNAAATANVTHPVKQGFIQTLGVFTDTLLICSCTAFIILLSDVHNAADLNGIQLTQQALSQHIGPWASIFVAVAIFLFAFSSLVGNYYYGETNIEFLNGSKVLLTAYRIAVLGMVMLGSVATIQIVWDVADLFMGIMAVINLVAIVFLSKYAFAALSDYVKQKKQGKDPVFYADSIPGLKNTECWDKSAVADKEKAV
ncbi:sodium:alanine symporter family protein [Bacillus thuringiensis serovar andalousiensis]|uniref:Sodium:alanine symporter family protein n=1 Tax=Bacillus thuringiensis TaxID=1428 RepID=A0A9X6K7Z8_BACTU|nr:MULTISPECIES: alanine/glycine:cation symporter family protein [Bacillus cereus group]MDA2614513.1 alanine/glycine:cation symporter family protein [Bacillus cereus]MEB8821537.1 alanine/glycine:cation symporter family protein [Bacillus cereus]MEB8973007.1 alanine/glycine:cation symporter family protein [Bacillus cereus]MEB9132661.1 alanine/glycine:cation symporter family protein [Bacillus cereus]MEB9511210.1 alanine/glycine:cation symporter family protein [Bacillus cereus]